MTVTYDLKLIVFGDCLCLMCKLSFQKPSTMLLKYIHLDRRCGFPEILNTQRKTAFHFLHKSIPKLRTVMEFHTEPHFFFPMVIQYRQSYKIHCTPWVFSLNRAFSLWKALPTISLHCMLKVEDFLKSSEVVFHPLSVVVGGNCYI